MRCEKTPGVRHASSACFSVDVPTFTSRRSVLTVQSPGAADVAFPQETVLEVSGAQAAAQSRCNMPRTATSVNAANSSVNGAGGVRRCLGEFAGSRLHAYCHFRARICLSV